jgi:hypothetical protein
VHPGGLPSLADLGFGEDVFDDMYLPQASLSSKAGYVMTGSDDKGIPLGSHEDVLSEDCHRHQPQLPNANLSDRFWTYRYSLSAGALVGQYTG